MIRMEDNPSPEEIRKRRLAYFELNNSSVAANAAFEKGMDINTLTVQEKSSDTKGKLNQSQPLADGDFEQKYTKNQVSNLGYQNDISVTDKKERSPSLERWQTRAMPNEATPTETSATRVEIRESTDRREDSMGEKSKTDSFSLLREELRAKAQCGDEEGYNSAVERLISLAKQEIAESENQKQLNSGQNSAKARYSEHSPRYLHHGETSLQKKSASSSQVSPKIEYVSSKKENLSPMAVEYEDFFSKSSKFKNSAKGPEVRESFEETEPHQLFQKSLGNVDDLGLSTHRPEEKPSKSIENFIPGEMRQVLGEEKYKEFLKKSTKDLDNLNSDRSSSIEEKIQKPEKPKLPEKPKNLKSESGLKLNIEKDTSVERKTENEKPRLNRPRFEPSNIYSQENEDEAENLSLPPSYRHGYESVHRNVVFSSDEIYHQAYLGQSPPVNRSYHGNPLHLSRDYSHGQTASAPRSSTLIGGHSYPAPMFPPSQIEQAPPFPSSQVPPPHFRTPYPPPEDMMYTARSQQSELYRQMYSGVTPRPVADSKLMDKPDVVDPNMYKPWPPEGPPQQFYDNFNPHNISRSQDNRYLAPHMSHPLEGNHYSYPVSHMSDSYYPAPPVPHSPDSRYIPQVPQSPDGRYMPFQVPRPPNVPFVHSSGDAGKHFQRRHDMMHHGPPMYPPQSPAVPGPEGEGVFPPYPPQRHGGIPYPPPPVNVDLASYFSFLAAQGFPVPYPVPVPGQDKKQINADSDNKESQEKENGGEEVLDMMIPHPPLQRKDSSEKTIHRKSSPRKIVTQEEMKKSEGMPAKRKSAQKTETSKKQEGKSASQKQEGKSIAQKQQGQNSSQRHVEEIRQFHEQRRQQEAEEDALLEKQRKFAKSSIDRYFSSLEKLYYRDRQEESRQEMELEEIPESSPREQDTEINTEVNTQVSKATSVKAEGITERMNKLGLDLSFLRESRKRHEEPQTEGKSVLVCEDCGEVNKTYMSWCGDCGESLAGVEVTIIKKSKPPRVAKKERRSEKKKVPVIPSDSSSNKSSQNDQLGVMKKESQDSGIPSSEERENTQAGREIEEIFEHVTDPVMKGFINSYFRKKHSELLQNSDVAEQVEDLFMRDSKENYEGEVSNSEGEVEEDSREGLEENAVSKQYANKDIDINGEDLSKYMDNEEVWFHEREKPKEKPLKHKRSAPIDVEVFSVQESRQQRDTCRSQEKIVPSLNLCISSDEDKPRPALDVSTDSEDWQDFFLPKPKEVEIKVEIPKEPEETRPFLEQVIGDMRSSSPTKTKSKNSRPENSGKMVKSIVRESIEAPGYERKWQRSSIAWSSFHPRELSTKSSLPPQRPGSAGAARKGVRGNTSGSTDNLSTRPRNGGSTENLATRPRSGAPQKRLALKSRPLSADPKVRSTKHDSREVSNLDLPVDLPVEAAPVEEETPPSIEQVEEERTQSASSEEGQKTPGIRVLDVTYPKVMQDSPPSDLPGLVDHRLQEPEAVTPAADAASVLHALHKYHEMTPRIRDGNFSVWLCLPDELLLNILSYLSHSDLIKCARTCRHFYRVCMDNTLWRYITVKKNHNLTDESLEQIGRHRPVSLALIQCHGDYITAKGLRNLFRACSSSLKELNFFGCSRGALTGDCILLHAASHCKGLTHIDASWCNVSDSGIGALANSANRLESLCISGCQMITNEGLITVIKKHGKWLRVLEMFGCFKMKAKGINYLAANCINLRTLNLGQCYKLTDSVISHLSTSLCKVETLDLRGCKQIKDNCIRYVVKYCNRLQTIILANCPNITDISLLEISTYLKDIRNIDVCGCRHVTDGGIRALANNCTNLRSIDISSTGCTHRSVLMMANFCSPRMESVKLNFLSDVTEHSVVKLIKHCKRLKLLHLYGCTSIRSLANIRDANPNVRVEM